MFDDDEADDDLHLFSSPEKLCSYIEAPSFNGTEEACLENGATVRLFLDKGAQIKGLLRKRYVDDFLRVNFEITADFISKERFRIKAIERLRYFGVTISSEAKLPEIFDSVENRMGIF